MKRGGESNCFSCSTRYLSFYMLYLENVTQDRLVLLQDKKRPQQQTVAGGLFSDDGYMLDFSVL